MRIGLGSGPNTSPPPHRHRAESATRPGRLQQDESFDYFSMTQSDAWLSHLFILRVSLRLPARGRRGPEARLRRHVTVTVFSYLTASGRQQASESRCHGVRDTVTPAVLSSSSSRSVVLTLICERGPRLGLVTDRDADKDLRSGYTRTRPGDRGPLAILKNSSESHIFVGLRIALQFSDLSTELEGVPVP